MINKELAINLGNKYLTTVGGSAIDRPKYKVDEEYVFEYPCGWFFYWNSIIFFDSGRNDEYGAIGCTPLLVDKIDGEIRYMTLEKSPRQHIYDYMKEKAYQISSIKELPDYFDEEKRVDNTLDDF
jgi:Immunity protein 35